MQIAERRRAKEQRLAEKHVVETNKELMIQQRERDDLGDKMAKEIENTTLKESLKVR